MTIIKRFACTLTMSLFAMLVNVQAQTPQLNSVNLNAAADKVRVSTQGDVFELKIEVVAESGETVFEGVQVAGQPLDWNMKDAQGRRVAAGTYTVTVSYLTQAGKPRKRIEQVLVTEAVTAGDGKERATEQATSSSPSPTALGSVTGQGTLNKIAKFTSATAVGNSIMTESAGRITIGVVTPTHTLTINGGPLWTSNNWSGAIALTNGSAIGWNTNGAGQRQGIGHSTGGLYFFRTASNLATTGSPSLYDMVISDKGYVGIGTTAPTTPLYVLSNVAGVSAVYGESASGRGVWGKSAGSRGVYGESQNSEGVHGESVNGTGVAAHGVTGVSGTGTTGPGVYGESAGSNLAAGVSGKGTSASGIGVSGEANSGAAIGVLGTTTSPSGAGVYARNLSTGRALFAEGNAGQTINANGFVKAMLVVTTRGGIDHCYNGNTNTSSGNCGFTVSQPLGNQVGVYRINFGFPVASRFVSVTAQYSTTTNSTNNSGANYRVFDNTSVEVFTFEAGDSADTRGSEFTIILY